MLFVALDPRRAEVLIRRSPEVPGSLWKSLDRNIAPDQALFDADGALRVPAERFLASRNWLGLTLRNHRCSVQFDPAIRALLEQADRESAEVKTALAGLTTRLGEASITRALSTTRFDRELKQFQLRDLSKLASLSHGANFSVPGAGKTTVAYALYEFERGRRRVDRLLVVAPLSAFDAWGTEAVACFDPPLQVAPMRDRPSLQAEVVLVNYQRLAARYGEIAEWVYEGCTHVILDEAHRMKRGRSGEWGRACLDLAHLAVRRDVLTGTPAPQHPSDFVALIDFLWPHQASRILPADTRHTNPTPTAMSELSNRLNPLFARTRKDELGLDQPVQRVELVTMRPLQQEIYEALRTKMRYATQSLAPERAMWGQMGEVVMYLLEAASNPALLSKAVSNTEPSRLRWPLLDIPASSSLGEKVLRFGNYEIPAKFEKLATMVATNAAKRRKTLVWSNFVDNLNILASELLAPYHPAVIHGSVPSAPEDAAFVTRESELRRFREDDDCQVLLANPAAMAEGVSLHENCHDAIYVDRTFNAGQYLQSIDRIHRLGLLPGTQTRITFLVTRGTIDETVDARIREKAERLSQLLSDPSLVNMALPDDESYGEWVELDDVDALLEHLAVQTT